MPLTPHELRQLNSISFIGPIQLWRPYISLILNRELSEEEAKEALDKALQAQVSTPVSGQTKI